jgi:alkylated DNA repair dioxygenase AlkB
MSLYLNEYLEIPGLFMIEDFIDEDTGRKIVDFINNKEWSNVLQRRVQHYGFIYNYRARFLTPAERIPDIFKNISDELLSLGIIKNNPDQVIVNEYKSGQGIGKHIDHTSLFGDEIISLSLISAATMVFSKGRESVDVDLPPRSVVIMKDDARWKWAHCIPGRRKDGNRPRKLRISLTFRKSK